METNDKNQIIFLVVYVAYQKTTTSNKVFFLVVYALCYKIILHHHWSQTIIYDKFVDFSNKLWLCLAKLAEKLVKN